jgi:hypothetical protein
VRPMRLELERHRINDAAPRRLLGIVVAATDFDEGLTCLEESGRARPRLENQPSEFVVRDIAAPYPNELRRRSRIVRVARHARDDRRLCGEHRMIELSGRVQKAGGDILAFKVRELGEDLSGCLTRGEELEYIDDANTHSADAGAPPALLGVDRDPGQQLGLSHEGLQSGHCVLPTQDTPPGPQPSIEVLSGMDPELLEEVA